MRDTETFILDEVSVEEVADRVAEALCRGGVCIVPTDTLYGIIALETQPESVQYLYEIKNRPADKPFIRLIGDMDSLKHYTDQVPPHTLARYWPGPLTLIFKNRPGGTIAVRYPDDPFLSLLFDRIGKRGIVAPSANLSGETDIFDCTRLTRTFTGLVDVIVCKKVGLTGRKASTIVDVTRKPWRILRQGEIELENNLSD
jgi:L-threonylcarbamoyladenylate synthase